MRDRIKRQVMRRTAIMNFNLNPGGILGGLLGAGATLALFPPGDDPGSYRGMARFVILGVIAGALSGNFLWRVVAGKPKADSEADPEAAREVRRRPVPRPTSGRPPRSAFRVIVGCVGIFLGILFLAFLCCGLFMYLGERDRLNWPYVIGDMTKFEAKEVREGEDVFYRIWVQYRYSVGGTPYVGYQIAPDLNDVDQETLDRLKDQYAVGNSVKVYHSPVHPSRSFLEPAVSRLAVYLVMIPVGLLLFAIAMITFGFWSPARRGTPAALTAGPEYPEALPVEAPHPPRE